MSQITIEIPEDALVALKLAPEQAGAEVRLAAAAKLYELGRLSSGSAAKLAGIPRVAFLARLAEYGIDSFRLTQEELSQEAPLA